MEAWTGGDPQLLCFRALALLLEGKSGGAETAEKLARQAIEQESRLTQPHMLLVEALAVQKKYDDAVVALKEYEAMTKRKVNVEGETLLKDFAASEEYKNYRAQ